MKILMSGASGFVGTSLRQVLLDNHHEVTALCRDAIISDQNKQFDCLVHLAGRAHVMNETHEDVYKAYKSVNVDYTMKVASLAKRYQIKRFVFLSSIKVNGETSDAPFNEEDSPAPKDAYGLTKLEAEMRLKDFCHENNMELVIIRPPLIYGPGVKANLKSLIKICNKPWPLPFGAINNKRSLISLQNLSSFIELCCLHPHAANQTFLISDNADISTTTLIRSIKSALGRNALQIPVPQLFLILGLNFLGKKGLKDRLFGNLQLDISKAKRTLNWTPIITFDEGIKKMVKKYVD